MKAIYIIAHENFRDEEYFEPKEILEKGGVEVVTASTNLTPAKGKLGGSAKIDMTINQINPSDYDAIIFAGGRGARGYIGDPAIEKLLAEFKARDKIIAAICIAPSILAKAGLLTGKKFTVHEDGKEIVAPLIPEEQDLVIDEKIITAIGPKAAEEFGKAILNKIQNIKSQITSAKSQTNSNL
jgi:protease I